MTRERGCRMAHHKRKGPKSTRNGCLMCKPHKHQRTGRLKRQRHSVRQKLHGDHRHPLVHQVHLASGPSAESGP